MCWDDIVGVDYGEGPPVPISNTEVKLTGADNTWLETAREDKLTPTQRQRQAKACRCFCVWGRRAGVDRGSFLGAGNVEMGFRQETTFGVEVLLQGYGDHFLVGQLMGGNSDLIGLLRG